MNFNRIKQRSFKKDYESIEAFLERGGKIQEVAVPKQTITESQIKSFYHSNEWKQARIKVLKELTPMCPVCGAEHNLVVDHIKPVRFFWNLRLDHDNLQILCEECNLEKASMPYWTIEYHIKNKHTLARERISKSIYINEKIARAEKKEAFSNMKGYERESLQSAYMSYTSRCKTINLVPVTKYDFRQYIEYTMGALAWETPGKIKSFVKKHFQEIVPPEKFLQEKTLETEK
jgi:hypothetical protein